MSPFGPAYDEHNCHTPYCLMGRFGTNRTVPQLATPAVGAGFHAARRGTGVAGGSRYE